MSVDNELLLVIKSSSLGDSEPDLGEKLMKSFLDMLLETGRTPARIIFMATGIFLTTEGSPVIETLQKFAERGSKIFTCGTCLSYYGKEEKLLIGEVGNMRDTVTAMLDFPKVLTP